MKAVSLLGESPNMDSELLCWDGLCCGLKQAQLMEELAEEGRPARERPVGFMERRSSMRTRLADVVVFTGDARQERAGCCCVEAAVLQGRKGRGEIEEAGHLMEKPRNEAGFRSRPACSGRRYFQAKVPRPSLSALSEQQCCLQAQHCQLEHVSPNHNG